MRTGLTLKRVRKMSNTYCINPLDDMGYFENALLNITANIKMIKKHKMIADFEQLTYTPEMLQNVWVKFADSFQLLINGGWTNNNVLDLIKYIIDKGYSNKFFPGSSMGTLLISKPKNGKLNYQQTLRISVDNVTNKVLLSYSDWDIIEKKEDWKKTIIWTAECSAEQLKEKFEEFIKWNKGWY